MNSDKSGRRLTFQRKLGYRKGVLVGNDWYEERQRFTKGQHRHVSTYMNDYYLRDSKHDREEMWNHAIEGQGIDPRLVMDQCGTKFHENYSSTTDLAHNYLPKCKPKQLRTYSSRKDVYLPEQDYAENYGNVTHWGLKENKKALNNYFSATATSDWISETQEVFQPPPKEAYTPRRAIGRYISSFLHPVNLQNVNLPLRNKPVNFVPEFPLKVTTKAYPHFYF